MFYERELRLKKIDVLLFIRKQLFEQVLRLRSFTAAEDTQKAIVDPAFARCEWRRI